MANNELYTPLINSLLPIIEKLENKDLGVTPDEVINTRSSNRGAIGRYQIMPATARALGYDPDQLTDPEYAETAARAVLADLVRQHGNDREAIVAGYNTSPAHVRNFKEAGYDPNFLLPETTDYIARYRELTESGTGQQATQQPEYHDHPDMPYGWNQLQRAAALGASPEDIFAFKQEETQRALELGASIEDIRAYWGDTNIDDTAAGAMYQNLGIQAAEEYSAFNPREAEGFWQHLLAGIKHGPTSAVRWGRPDWTQDADADFTEKLAFALGAGADEMGWNIIGAVGGAFTGGIYGGAVGSTALPAAIREAGYAAWDQRNGLGPQSFSEGAQRFANSAMQVGTEGLIGAAFVPGMGIGGNVVARSIFNFGGEQALKSTVARGAIMGGALAGGQATATGAQIALTGEVPTMEDFITNSIAMVALGGVEGYVTHKGNQWYGSHVQRAFEQRMRHIYARTGITPTEVRIRSEQSAQNFLHAVYEDYAGEPVGQYGKISDDPLTPRPQVDPGVLPEQQVLNTNDGTKVLFGDNRGEILEPISDADIHPDSGRIGDFGIDPDQARRYGYDPRQLLDPEYNARAAGGMMSALLLKYKGDLEAAYVAFHAGEGLADAYVAGGRPSEMLPVRTQNVLRRAEQMGAFEAQYMTSTQEQRMEAAAAVAGKAFYADQGAMVEDKTSIGSYLMNMGKRAGFNFWVGDAETQSAAVHSGTPYRHPHYRPFSRSVFIPATPETLNRRWYGLGRYEIIHHEVGHAIDFTVLGNEQRGGRGTIRRGDAIYNELLAISKRFRPKLWEIASGHNLKPNELMADAIAVYLSNKSEHKNMPLFIEKFGDKLRPYLDIAASALPVKMSDGSWRIPPGAEKVGGEQGGGFTFGDAGAGNGGAGDGGGNGGGGATVLPPEDGGPFRKITNKRWQDNMPGYILEQLQLGMIYKHNPESFLARGKEYAQSAYEGYITELARFERVDAKLRKKGLLKDGMAGVADMFRNTYGSAGRADHMIRKGGISALEGNTEYKALRDVPAVMDAFKLAKANGGSERGFISWMLSARQLEKSKQGIDVGARLELAQAARHFNEFKAIYEPPAALLRKANNAKLDYMADSNLYSQETVNVWKRRNKYYIPFFDANDNHLSGTSKGGKFRPKQQIRQMHGVDNPREILEPATELFQSFHNAVAQADRNRAVGTMVGAAEAGIVWGLKRIEDKHRIDIITPDGKTVGMTHDGKVINDADFGQIEVARRVYDGRLGDDQFVYYRNGRREIWQAEDPGIAKLMRGLAKEEADFGLGVARAVAKMMRAGITRMPDYLAKMIIRDQFVAPLVNKHGGVPFQNLVHGIFDMLGSREHYERFVLNGGMSVSLASYDINHVQRDVNKIFREAGTWNRVKNLVPDALAGAQFIADRVDALSRVGQMKRDVKSGRMAPVAAAMNARRAYLDFSEKGTVQLLNKWASITPFMRPAILSLRQDGSALKNMPASTIAKAMMYITLPSIGLWYLNYLQDQTKEPDDPSRWDNRPQWERDTHFIPPEVGGVTLRIPRAQGIWGVGFGSIAERFMEWLVKDDPRAFNELGERIVQMLIPPIQPAIVTPMLENKFNVSTYTDRRIVPASMEEASGSMQYTDNTTQIAINLSKFISDSTGIEWSPMYMENYIRGWGGTLGQQVLRTLDRTLMPTRERAPTQLADIPIVASFVVRNPTMQATPIQNFYDVYNQFKRRERDFELAVQRRDPLEMERASRHLAAFVRLDAMAKALSNQYETLREINALPTTGPNAITETEKAQFIETIYTGMIGIARSGLMVADAVSASQDQLEEQRRAGQ